MVARWSTRWQRHPVWCALLLVVLATLSVSLGTLAARAGTPPSPPTSVRVVVGDTIGTVATVSWSAEDSSAATFRVYRAKAATGPFTWIGTTIQSPFNDITGQPHVAYWYRVSAVSRFGDESAQSAIVGPVTAQWSLPSPHAAYGSGSLCGLCHVPHQATNSLLMKNVGEPAGEVPVCYYCHDGTGSSADIKTAFSLSSGHTVEDKSTGGDLTNSCSGCHGPHHDPTSRPKLWRSTVNGATVTGPNNTWCLACHNDANDWYTAGTYPTTPSRDASDYPVAGTFPGKTTYNDAAKNPHANIPATKPTASKGSCLLCHAPHRSATKYDALVATFTPSTADTVSRDRTTGDYAALCLSCHGGQASWVASGAVDIKRFVTHNGASSDVNSGHRIKTAGGTLPVGAPLPCYDCHNPHGSKTGNRYLLSDERWTGIGDTTATPTESRKFCLACHVTSDGKDGAGVVLASSDTTRLVEGLPRVPSAKPANQLSLVAKVGQHASSSTASCVSCHGRDYSSAGSSNVHDPGAGESAGGVACFACHALQSMQSASSYHHYVATDTAGAYPSVADATSLTSTDTRRSCLMCHVDHDYFSPSANADAAHTSGRAQNLRAGAGVAPSKTDGTTYRNTDYDESSATGGVCLSCHTSRITKNTANRKTDKNTNSTVALSKVGLAGGVHMYVGAPGLPGSRNTTFTSDASPFLGVCVKCHNDKLTKQFQDEPFKFGLHDSSLTYELTDANQANVAEDPQEAECYLCHSRAFDAEPHNPNGGSTTYADQTTKVYDLYKAEPGMLPTDVNVKGSFTAAGIVSRHPVGGDGVLTSRVECANCHNVHKTQSDGGLTMNPNVVSDPDNTLNSTADGAAAAYWAPYDFAGSSAAQRATNRDFCLRCHDGITPAYTNTATTYVPYSVFVPDQSLVFNPSKRTDNKTAHVGTSHFNIRSADTSSTARTIDEQCVDCHDQHGSTLPALLGKNATDPTGPRRINGRTVLGNDNSVCAACHTSASPEATPTRDATGYLMTGTWPGMSVYSGAKGIHNGVDVKWPGREGDYAGGDCKNCHDVHGTANAYDELRTENAAGTEGTYRFSSTEFSFCFNCHDGSPAAIDVKQFYPATSGGTSSDARAGHRTKTAGTLPSGSALPCYDCHNPHGSGSAFGLLVVTQTSSTTTITVGGTLGELVMDPATRTDGDIRHFCFTCHTTADTTNGWNGAQMATVTAGAKVEGIDRTVYDAANERGLKLPPVSGHNAGDTQACYNCHGNDYNAGGNNVHSPGGGISLGGTSCYTCHSSYQTYMEDGTGAKQGASRTSVYHHTMGGTVSGTYADGDTAPKAGTYPNLTNSTRTDVFCVSCHTDHNYFNASKGANLRQSVDSAGSAAVNTDFIAGGSPTFGVCASCHDQSIAKDTTNQKPGTGVAENTPIIAASAYSASAHRYGVSTSFSGSSFSADCSKCHDDENATSFQSGNSFSTHFSSEKHLLKALGVAINASDEAEQTLCYACHSGDVTGPDGYGVGLMSQASRRVQTEFTKASKHPVVATGTGSLTCGNCHNVHTSASGSAVADPSNTYQAAPYGSVAQRDAFCLACHDGSVPTKQTDATTYVPATVTMAQPGMDKTAYAARAHWSAGGSISSAEVKSCADCHDKHASDAPKLLGIYDPTSNTNKIGSFTITANDQTVCRGCHEGASTDFPGAVAGSRDANGYPQNGTWPGYSVYSDATNGIHRVGRANVVYPGSGKPAGDCKNCHDVHGTANAYDETTAPFTSSTFTLCFDCHDGSPASTDIKQYYPVSAGGTSADTRSGHRTKTPGNLPADSALPCYDCHNPHGSASVDGLLIVSPRSATTTDVIGDAAGEIDLSTPAGVRNFCLSCHTTNDTTQGFVPGAGLTTITAGAKVEGIDRTVYDATNKRGLKLPPVSGHNAADTQNCYTCHGNDYSAGGKNVHDPAPGVSSGATSCYTCHSSFKQTMDAAGTARANTYHHVLGTSSTVFTGDMAPGSGTYPTSQTDVYCVSCHTDHNNFNASKGANLRKDIAVTGGTDVTNSDYITSGTYGICVSCHATSQVKQGMGTDQAAGGAANTPVVGGLDYSSSAHQYSVGSSFGTSAFNANCSKCHSDEQTKSFQTSTNKFGTHLSSTSSLLGTLGAFTADPPKEQACFKCHNATSAPYGETLSASAKQTQSEFARLSTHDLTKVACVNCHNVHDVSAANPVSNADNTYSAASMATKDSTNTFCFACHDGTAPTQTVNGTTYVPYSVTASSRANVAGNYATDGHGMRPPFSGRADTGYATAYNDMLANWTNDANSTGAPDGLSATSSTNNNFELRNTFTFPSDITSIDTARVTVRSRAAGNWGAATGGTTAGQQILHPSSDVAVGSWTTRNPTTPATDWDKIDDPEPATANDGDTTYIQAAGTTAYGAGIAAPTVPSNATNITVSVVWVGRDVTTITQNMNSRIRVGATTFYNNATARNPGTTYQTFTDTWATNPATGVAWTPTTVNTLSGVGIVDAGTTAERVTQMYLQVDYQVPAYYDDTWAIQYTTNGTTWNDIVAPNNNAEAALADHTLNLTGILTAANRANFAVRVLGSVVNTTDNVGTIQLDSVTLDMTDSGTGGTIAGCRDCHEQHGSTLQHLLTTTAGGNPVASYSEGVDEAQCLACHRAGGAAADDNIAQYYPTSASGTADAGMTRSGHRTKTAGLLPAGSAVPCRQCHNPHGGAGSGYMLVVRTQTTPGLDTLIGDEVGELAMADSQQVPANAVAVRRFCLSCHTDTSGGFGWNGSTDAAVLPGCQVLGIDRTSGVLRLPTLPNGVKGHGIGDTTYSCYLCHGDDFSSSTSVNVHNPGGGESRGGISCYTCHTVYRDKMEDGSGSAIGASRTQSYHHVLGSTTAEGDTTTYPTSSGSSTDVFCLSCHVDHNLFSPFVNGTYARSANLRSTIGPSAPASPAEAINTDFQSSGSSYYATTFTQSVGTWTSGANSLNAPDGATAVSPTTNNFDGRHTFTLGSWSNIASARVTVRSRAAGNWGMSGTIAQQQIIHPTSDVALGSWTTRNPTTPTTDWDKIDDPEPTTANDGDTTYIQAAGTTAYGAGISAPTVPSNATNISVSVLWVGRDVTTVTQNMNSRIRVGTTTFYNNATARNPGTTYTTYTDAWATNPATGAAWTPATVNTISGIGVVDAGTSQERVTQMYLQVDYQAPVTYNDTWAIQYTTNGTAWSNIVAPNATAEAALTDHTLDLTGILTAANYTNFAVRILGAPVGAADNANTVEWDSTTLELSASAGNGPCMACHTAAQTKDTTNQKSYSPSTVTPALTVAGYGASAHDYTASSTFTDNSTFNANCSKCHDSEIDGGGMERGKSTSGFQTSANKFSVHYSAARRILAAMGVNVSDPLAEEAVCYKCHSVQADGLKSTTNQDYYGTATMDAPSQAIYGFRTATYGHHVGDYVGLHANAPQDETQAYISANKHVECADCHDVHESKNTHHTTNQTNGNDVSGVLTGVQGASATFSTTNWTAPTGYAQSTPAIHEYEICFKCHSGANTNVTSWGGTGAAAWTDQGLEFSTSNQSYHPVVAALPATDPGVNGSSQLAARDMRPAYTVGGVSYGGWTNGKTMYCSDCHAESNAGSLGPHGSAVKWMLKGPNQAWPYQSAAANGTSSGTYWDYASMATNLDTQNGLFCRNCHVVAVNGVHDRTGDHSIPCVNCHIRVPHGGKVSRLLTGTNMPARYSADGQGGGSGTAGLTTGFIKMAAGSTYSNAGNCAVSGCGQHAATITGGETW